MCIAPQFRRAFSAVAIAPLLLAAGGGAAAETPRQIATAGKQLKEVFRELASDDFTTRESAQLKLQKLATAGGGDKSATLDRYLDQYLDSTDPEVRYRLRSAMFDAVAANTPRKGFIGISMDRGFGRQFPQGGDSVRVIAVIPNSAADRFGLQAGDEIVEIDGKPFDKVGPLEASRQLQEYVQALAEGDPLRLSIRRRGQMIEKAIELGGMPDIYDPMPKERVFDNWMHEELVERGLAEPRPTIMPRRQSPVPAFPGVEPRFVPRIVPIPQENLFPERE